MKDSKSFWLVAVVVFATVGMMYSVIGGCLYNAALYLAQEKQCLPEDARNAFFAMMASLLATVIAVHMGSGKPPDKDPPG
jgi:hypothetical protein